MGEIYHAHLHGLQEQKYSWLQTHDINDTEWSELTPQTPFYLMIPQSSELLPEYQNGWKITEIMPLHSTGVKTHRDHFATDFDHSQLRKRIEDFRNLTLPHERIADLYQLKDTRDWKLAQKRTSLSSNSAWTAYFTKMLYRPFDFRAYFHHEDVVELPRNEVMLHLLNRENLALSTTRSIEIGRGWEHIFCTDQIIQHHTVSIKETNYVFPLYLYHCSENAQKSTLLERQPNLSQAFMNALISKIEEIPAPEAIFHYIYAILHSSTYRNRYAEFLKADFPRIPLTSNKALFEQLSKLGEELVSLHLMKSPKLDAASIQFTEQGGNCVVDAGHPKYTDGKVVINKKGDQFIDVPENVWNFYVGGYQVCQKWLKDRKGRTLSQEDITHYQRIIVALSETIRLMEEIDRTIPNFPIE